MYQVVIQREFEHIGICIFTIFQRLENITTGKPFGNLKIKLNYMYLYIQHISD